MKKEVPKKKNNNRHQSKDDTDNLLCSATISEIWDIIFGPVKKKRTI